VGDGEEHQIVCGAPNIAQGQKVVVALPGTLMPNGEQIWPGALRGVDSYGMICSARELGLPHAPQKRGIMVVPDNFEVGAEFEPTKCDELIASGEITL
jgi:tRNA-binding protein